MDHLTKEDNKRLFNENPLPRDKIILGNIRLVHKILEKYPLEKKDDLFGYGVIGLIKAVDDFKIETGNSFSTYAYPKIEGEIKRALRDKLGERLPRRSRKALVSFKEYQNNGEDLEEIVEKYNLPKEDILNGLRYKNPESLFKEVDEDQDRLIDLVSNGNEINIDHIHCKNIFSKLKKTYRKIIKLKTLGYTQEEIAKEVDMYQSSVSRIERRIQRVVNEGTPIEKTTLKGESVC